MTNECFAELRLAAALAYHLPAATLEMTTEHGEHRLIADVSDPLADLHPGELRDLVGHALEVGHTHDLLTALDLPDPARLSVRLLTAPPMLTDCGAGLYSVATASGRGTLLFATLLDPNAADSAIGGAGTAPTVDSPVPPLGAVLSYDEVLAVTVVGFGWHRHTATAEREPVAEFARSALAACAVAEQFPVTPS